MHYTLLESSPQLAKSLRECLAGVKRQEHRVSPRRISPDAFSTRYSQRIATRDDQPSRRCPHLAVAFAERDLAGGIG